MSQRTLVVIKPDGVEMGFVDDIIYRYLDVGLKLRGRKRLRLTKEQAEEFYKEHAGRPFFAGLVLAMTSGPVEALVFDGKDAVEVVRKLNGATDPREAESGTIRHDYRSAGGPFNTVHGSDSLEAALREIKLIGAYTAYS